MLGFPFSLTHCPTTPVPAQAITTHNGTSARLRFATVICYRHGRWLVLLLLAVVSAVTLIPRTVYADEPLFAQAVQFGSTESIRGLAVGDLNGDGWLDIVQGNSSDHDNNLSPSYVYLNDGHGGFIRSIRLGNGEDTRSVAVGDLNGDGWLDIIRGNYLQQSYVYLNDGRGNFTQLIPLGKDEPTQSVAVGDLNGDGWLDIVQGNSYNSPSNKQPSPSYVYLNDGHGGFTQAMPLGKDEITQSVAVGDLNGDSSLDIIQGNKGPSYVYLNGGHGTFTQTLQFDTSADTRSVVVGDLNGDGFLDIVQGNSSDAPDQQPTPSYVYLNNRQGAFTPRIPLGNGERTSSVAVGDLDGNGLLDIVQGNSADSFRENGPSYVYLNDGQGAFTQSTKLGNIVATRSVAVGDLDGDGFLDIVQGTLGPTDVYRNDGQGVFTQTMLLGSTYMDTRSIALGDLDSNGWLDIVQGNAGPSYVYLNDGQGAFTPRIPLGNGESTSSVAVGDLNGDGSLDIVQGNVGPSYVYLNDGHGLFPTTGILLVGHGERTESVAVGDLNGDGLLDIVQGNYLQQSYVYLNDGHGGFTQAIPLGNSERNQSVAVGDLNGDGSLDIVQGNDGLSYVYLNDGQGHFPVNGSPLGHVAATHSVVVGDLNGDGSLDIVQGNFKQQSVVYLNNGQGHFPTTGIKLGNSEFTNNMAVGDLNGDGPLDIVQGNMYNYPYTFLRQQSYVYLNGLRQVTGLANQGPLLTVTRPGPTGNANFFSTPALLSSPTIPITYTLFDQEGDRVGRLEANYSLNGGGKWLPAVATSTTVTTNLTTARVGVHHVFQWDTFASGFFGQSDNVVLRLVAYTQPLSTTLPITGSYRYTNSAAGSYQQPYATATTFPFRVRGTQVRVVNEENNPLVGALVYRLLAGQFSGATPMADPAGQPFRTNAQGYLSGRGVLQLDDGLVALLPVTPTHPLTFTHQYSYFLTSAAPNTSGLTLTQLSRAGVVTLTVPTTPNSTHSLMLFNLTVSLEWDAGDDDLFRLGLENGFKRASEILYKVTNGQAALGRVDVFPTKRFWNRVDLILYASNSLRPSAAIGGVVKGPMSEIVFTNPDQKTTKRIAAAYVPGQIRMGPSWDPFGEEAGDLSEQWWRALAHELSHHLLFLPDDYVGFKTDGFSGQRVLGRVDCKGSFMTTTFDPSYTQFLDHRRWLDDCQQTLAALSTGRTDWETITHFYPIFKAPPAPPQDDRNSSSELTEYGPNLLPLDVTHLVVWPAPNRRPTLPARYFQLRSGVGEIVRLPTAHAYLFQTQGNADPTDDVLLALGSPTGGGDRIKVRGGQLGDRLCLFDFGASDGKTYTGCIRQLSAANVSIPVRALEPEQPGARWAPAIDIRAITTRTLVVTVTQALPPNAPLKVQVFPAHYPSASGLAPVAALTLTNGVYVGQVHLPYPASDVAVRVWVDDETNLEAISQFNLQLPWQPGDQVMGGPDTPISGGPDTPISGGPDTPISGGPDTPISGGPDTPISGGPDYPIIGGAPHREFAAPALSADAQVVIYSQEGVFAPSGIQSLQILPSPPALTDEPWLTAVGQAYFVQPEAGNAISRTIAVTYLQRDVPEGYEYTLTLYFLPQKDKSWRRLRTRQFVENLLVADLQSVAGTYAVMATVVLPELKPGLNLFTYPLSDSRPVTEALTSIHSHYAEIYEVLPNGHLESAVDKLIFGHIYAIRIEGNQSVTLYLAPPRRLPSGVVPGSQ